MTLRLCVQDPLFNVFTQTITNVNLLHCPSDCLLCLHCCYVNLCWCYPCCQSPIIMHLIQPCLNFQRCSSINVPSFSCMIKLLDDFHQHIQTKLSSFFRNNQSTPPVYFPLQQNFLEELLMQTVLILYIFVFSWASSNRQFISLLLQ